MPDSRFVSYAPDLEDVMLWRALRHVPPGTGRYAEVGAPVPDRPGVARAFHDRGWSGATAASETHFLHIGPEAATAGVLAALDVHDVQPWIVLVASPEQQPELEVRGYRHVWFDGHNRFYLSEAHADLARHFHLPPNASDQFKTYDPVLEAELAAARRQLLATEQLAQSRLTQLAALEAKVERRDTFDAETANAPQPAAIDAIAPTSMAVAAARPEIALRGRARRIGAKVYRLVRPVARPLVWRTRLFMTGELMREMADVRAKLDLLLNRGTVSATGLDSGIAPAIERLLLTLALEQPDPPAEPPDRTD